MTYQERIKQRLELKRKLLAQAKERDDFARCLFLDGEIFALEGVYCDLLGESGCPPLRHCPDLQKDR